MFGFSRKSMYQSCRNVLAQLCQSMASSPIYRGVDTSIRAFSEGIIRIHQEENGRLVNNFDFYPNSNGWIDSVAIYGTMLDSHYRIISGSMEIFGLRVSEITHEGNYVNVELDQTQFPN